MQGSFLSNFRELNLQLFHLYLKSFVVSPIYCFWITPIGFNIKKTPCVGNPSKNFLLLWGKELAAAQFKLSELTISESVQKLFNLETEFISKFSLYTVQEDWLLKTKNHLEKYEKKLRLKKLKKIRMLASTDDLYFACLERFEGHYQFFCLKSRFLIFVKVLFLILKIYIIFYIWMNRKIT